MDSQIMAALTSLYNGSTGPGFFGLGILAVLDTVGVINPAAWIIWTTLFAVLAAGFGLEYRYNSKSGSCYIACDPKG
jgi:hypothetical protein